MIYLKIDKVNDKLRKKRNKNGSLRENQQHLSNHNRGYYIGNEEANLKK